MPARGQVLADLRAAAFDFFSLAHPLLCRPDLEAASKTDDHDVRFELRVLAKIARDDDPPELVRHGAQCAAEEAPLEPPWVRLPPVEIVDIVGLRVEGR